MNTDFQSNIKFSKTSKYQIDQLQQYVDNQNQRINADKEASASANEQISKTSELSGKVDTLL